jgi:hypothetical protein
MAFCRDCKPVFLKCALVAAAMGLAFLAMPGCTSNSSRTKVQDERPAEAPAQAPALLLNLNCVFDWIGSPTESFHYSYSQHGESVSLSEEADVTPQSLDGTVNSMRDGQTYPPVPVHAVRSDTSGWRSGVGQLQIGFGMPASLMMANQMSSALVREGAEKVNGYDTVRYSVDTTRLSAVDRRLLGTSSDKGTVWVTGPGCPVKIVIDTEMQGSNGSISKTHYEEAIVKK